jgi:hypothetical protein
MPVSLVAHARHLLLLWLPPSGLDGDAGLQESDFGFI